MLKFRIRLKSIHEQRGVTYYRVAKESGVSHNTVQKYAEVEYVDSDILPTAVVALARYYGVPWSSPPLVEVIEVNDEDEG